LYTFLGYGKIKQKENIYFDINMYLYRRWSSGLIQNYHSYLHCKIQA
jgi:hypothetical protein